MIMGGQEEEMDDSEVQSKELVSTAQENVLPAVLHGVKGNEAVRNE